MLSCTATAVVGTAAAFLVERVRVIGSRFWAPLLVAPLAIPAFVTSYGWVSLFPAIDGLFGASLIMTLAYFPFVFLPVAAALRGLDPAWEEQARTLGLRPAAVFVRVVLPQLRPAILGGTLLVGLHCLSEFGAFSMLRFATFTTAIYDQYSSSFASHRRQHAGGRCWWRCCLILVAAETARGRVRDRHCPGRVRRRPAGRAAALGCWCRCRRCVSSLFWSAPRWRCRCPAWPTGSAGAAIRGRRHWRRR